ncbi:hypothetical protein [Alteromonas sp. a30]|uniref:hypothetical protein n=1 Tax=Alteromonas sp. a30 TaxID=2730917 RepID=UPI00227E3FEA|nr:hypothetical protein [Alteromonas sp. a30]MCY7296892.1 hypothetical protein [Alteromonas sp. a30]
MSIQTIWGVIDKYGRVMSGSGFSVKRDNDGEYVITFSTPFTALPAITGSQVLYGSTGEWPSDGVVFPILSTDSATAITGGKEEDISDRTFSFIAIGPV